MDRADRIASTSTSTGSGMPDSERVVAALKASGQMDRLRAAALTALQHDAELRQLIEERVKRSEALHNAKGEKPRKLMSRLADEVSGALSEEALHCLWRVLSQGGVSHQIDEAIREVLCQQMHDEEQQQQQQSAAAQRRLPAASQ